VPVAPSPHYMPLAAGQARQLLKALADPIRIQVVEALGGGERCVCELTAELGLAQSKLSFHLKVMKEAGLIEAREEGRWTYYQLQPELLGQLGAWLASLACQASRIPALTCGSS
jgi:ArsR family transcriptional regulator, arsenate/arsenite/antimonite-responsive transcriptional repressor